MDHSDKPEESSSPAPSSDIVNGEDDAKPYIYGVLKLDVHEARRIYTDEMTALDNLYVKITLRSLSKKTKVVLSQYGNPRWDQTKHFPVTVARNRKHPFNLIKIQVFRFGSHSLEHKEVGSIAFHLHDVISHSPIDGSFDIFDSYQNVGEIRLGLSFTYGMFGFGYSAQLKESAQNGDHFLKRSLFPRVDPPPERQDPYRATLVPKALKHPYYVPFHQKVLLGYGEEVAAALDSIPDDHAKYEALQAHMVRLPVLMEGYRSIPTRSERLAFLNKTILSSNSKVETIKDKVDSGEEQYTTKKYIKYVKPVAGDLIENKGAGEADKTTSSPGMGAGGARSSYSWLNPLSWIRGAVRDPESVHTLANSSSGSNSPSGHTPLLGRDSPSVDSPVMSSPMGSYGGSPVLSFMERMRRDNA